MPDQRTSPSGRMRFVAMSLCFAVAACNNDRAGKGEEPPIDTQSLALSSGQCSLIGNFREFNDDALAVKDLGGSTLYLAADGMGGEVGGKVVGQVACARAIEVLTRELKGSLPGTTPDQVPTAVRRAIVAANEGVIASSDRDPDLRNMGATIVLALWQPQNGLVITGVGDCRIYRVRGGTIEQLTVDHTVAQALVESKVISPEEARTHRMRNVLWKYLGSKEVGDGPEPSRLSIQPGDRLLLCTKGFHEVIPAEQMLSGVRGHPEAQKCADVLCRMALKAGSRGNISCLVIDVAEKK